VTGGVAQGVKLQKSVIGKPHRETYEFAEKRLVQHREESFKAENLEPLRVVYMIGDNPESDVRGANSYNSPIGAEWIPVLVRSGVYSGGEPAWKPRVIVDDVKQAVEWALTRSRWHLPLKN
jgi:ribonucleotide monophosphatase NagD (HAD superfamily)